MGPISIENGMANQALMTSQDERALAFMNDVIDTPGLVIGSNAASAVKIANTVHYKNMGKFFAKTTAEIAFTATAPSNIANLQEQCFLLTLDNAGAGLLIPGLPTTGPGTALMPDRPATALLLTKAAIVAGAAVVVAVSNVNNLVAGQSITVDVGGQAETITLTSIDNSHVLNPTITATFANNHPADTLIKWALTPIGSVRIYCGGASTFTAGTTLLTATGLVVTYENGSTYPLFQVAL